MWLWKAVVASLLLFANAQPATAQVPEALIPATEPAGEAATPVAAGVPGGGRALERADLEAWVDGYMPFALARGDIAGAVVVVVKDGRVLLQKGYGYSDVANRVRVDPDRTLFRPGSVSKLFTWTAVMQLVEQGRLDLDRDVNAYLDFAIPPYQGKPVTLRNLLTHTPGFEETARYLIAAEPLPLADVVKRSLPKRVFAPGTTPAYSNYGTALAGYIVERVSGRPFDDYVEQRIFRPLGMTRSTFRQPLPAELRPLMSEGYALGSGEPMPFEIVGPGPAGSLSATGADMARFMIAHLDDGRGLLRPETARTMHDSRLTMVPPLNRMALGFYERNINGRRVIAHAGDTQYFHAELSLFLDEKVGLYLAVNSSGAEGAPGPLRAALFEQFANRYFPAAQSDTRVDPAIARQHAQMMAGTYTNTRGFNTVFLSILGFLEQAKMGVDEDGGIAAPENTSGLARQPRDWIEIAPFVWRDVESGDRIAAKVENGQVVRWSFDDVSPFMMFDRVPWYRDSAWLLPAFLAGLTIVSLTALTLPAGAIARRRYGARRAIEGRRLRTHRWTTIFAWLALAVLVGWGIFITIASEDLTLFGGALDWLLWTLQILSPIVFFGLVGLAAWTLWLVWTGKRGWFARLWSVLLLLGSIMLLWVALGFHLIGFGTNY